MAQFQSQSIPREQFLLMSINLLHKAFIESTRTQAKNAYREMASGKVIHLTSVQMEDKSTARFNLALDHSEFRGKLNYGAFRASLATLIGNITQNLREEQEVTVYNTDQDPTTMIFGVTAVTVEDEEPNVMVLGADLAGEQAAVMLRLMYLDPAQFVEQQS